MIDKKRGGQPGNANAKKDTLNDDVLYLRVPRANRVNWLWASKKRKLKLRDWVMEALDNAAARDIED